MGAHSEDKMIRLGVWNIRYNKEHQKEKFDKLSEKVDIAIFIEADEQQYPLFKGLEKECHLANSKHGIRAWVNPKSGITLKVVSDQIQFDPQKTNLAVPYIVSKEGAAPFCLVAVWTNTTELEKKVKYEYLMSNIIQTMQTAKDQIESMPLLIVGDTNLLSKSSCENENEAVQERDESIKNLVKELIGKNNPANLNLLDITDNSEEIMELEENKSVKSPRSTLFHPGKKDHPGKWFCCDLAIASESMERRIIKDKNGNKDMKIGNYKDWHTIALDDGSGSDHLPLFINISE